MTGRIIPSNRCAIAPSRVSAMKLERMPKSSRRGMVIRAPMMCRVENTRWPMTPKTTTRPSNRERGSTDLRQAAICRAIAWASASTLGMDFFQGGGDRLLKMRVGGLIGHDHHLQGVQGSVQGTRDQSDLRPVR